MYCWYLIQGENTPVWIAAHMGNVDMLNMLIDDAGGDVNIANGVSLYTLDHSLVIHYVGSFEVPG